MFGYFAIAIGHTFFPPGSAANGTLMAALTFGVGFLARPFGGLVIGRYADRRGRGPALVLTLAIMFVGTASIAFCPPFRSIGYLAPALLVVARLLQGFSAGGEFGASTTMLLEHAPRGRSNFYMSFQIAGQGLAALTGAVAALVLLSVLGNDATAAWGWRIPFIAGLSIGALAVVVRVTAARHIDEPASTRVPVTKFFQDQRRALLAGIGAVVGGAATAYVVIYYMPTLLIGQLKVDPRLAYGFSCAFGSASCAGALISGWLVDRARSPRQWAIFWASVSAVLIWPSFWLLHSGMGLLVPLVAMTALIAATAAGIPIGLLMIMRSFPTGTRAMGLSLVYSVGVGVMGGFGQFIVAWLLRTTSMAPAIYVSVCAVITIISLLFIPEATVAEQRDHRIPSDAQRRPAVGPR